MILALEMQMSVFGGDAADYYPKVIDQFCGSL